MGCNRSHGLIKVYTINGKEFHTIKELSVYLDLTVAHTLHFVKKGVAKDGTIIRVKTRTAK